MQDDLLIQSEMFEFEPFDSRTANAQFEASIPVDVRWVQNSLNRILGLRLPIDGVAGPATRSGTRAFQKKQGLKADGVAGPHNGSHDRCWRSISSQGAVARFFACLQSAASKRSPVPIARRCPGRSPGQLWF
jgi:hypothetical protein